MNKIKIGVQVTAKVCPTKVTVSGTFQGYELQDKEDPTSVCGKVFYVKDGMQLLDFVYVDSIKVCKGEDEDERIRKELIEYLTHRSEVTGFIDEDKDCKRWIAYLEKQKEQKPIFKKGDKVIWDDEEFNILDVNETEYNVGGYRVPFSRQNELHPIWQKSAEWSEEDKTHLCWIIECFDSWKYQVPEFADQYQSAIDWLKSLRPDSYKNCNSRWKPSEEQMEAIENVIKCELSAGLHTRANILQTLQNDLKKL